jgi:hypothetical protein
LPDTTENTRTFRGKLGTGVALHWIGRAWVDSDKRTNSFDPDTGDRIEGYPELGGSAWAFGLGS